MTGRHQRRSQHGVVILDLALTPQTTRALRAMDIPRTMMFRAVERDQRVSAQPAEHIQAARSPLELFNHVAEHGMQQIRGSRIQHVTDMIIRRYFRQAEQRLAVGSRAPLLKSTLVL